jgi:1-acyl-sn-glycerol-3-phosphate acyltransferase
MPLDALRAFLDLPREQLLAALPGFLASYVLPGDDTQARVRAGVAAVRDAAAPGEWDGLLDYMRQLGTDYGHWEGNALAARLATAFMDTLLRADSTLEGVEHLDVASQQSLAGRRVMLVGNHLSYADTITLRHLLLRAGREEAVARLTAVAGPKVYEEPMRRLSVAALHSIKVAQSASVASGSAARGVSPREMVAIARRCLEEAERAMDRGRLVLLYPEGTRSRSGRLQPFLRATARWLSIDGLLLVPVVVWGGEKLYGLEDDRMRPATAHGRIGPPLDTRDLVGARGMGRDEVLAAAHAALQALLPEEYRAPEGQAVVV